MKNKIEDDLKLFVINNQFAELDLDRLEEEHKIDLGRKKNKQIKDNIYYPQFESEIRIEAKRMSKVYEVFYCLENSIRELITSSLESSFGDSWWNEKAPQNVRDEVTKRIKNEIDSGVTPRSHSEIDFTTFGELGEIIKTNWDIFGTIFNSNSKSALERVMKNLNTLRAPIAHCSNLAEDEVLRLQLSVKDWFRLME